MKKTNDLPDTIPVFPLSNFIIFPETNVPLNIFEPRYLQMVDEYEYSQINRNDTT